MAQLGNPSITSSSTRHRNRRIGIALVNHARQITPDEILMTSTRSEQTANALRTEAFRQFQYPTVPLHVSDDFMNTALRKAITPALEPANATGKDR